MTRHCCIQLLARRTTVKDYTSLADCLSVRGARTFPLDILYFLRQVNSANDILFQSVTLSAFL